jgi:hypothetical protein
MSLETLVSSSLVNYQIASVIGYPSLPVVGRHYHCRVIPGQFQQYRTQAEGNNQTDHQQYGQSFGFPHPIPPLFVTPETSYLRNRISKLRLEVIMS